MKSQNDYQTSQNLLILQNRQIVHHMLSIQDWIVLSIYTPNQHDTKPNFSKHKNKQSQYQSKRLNQQKKDYHDITKLLSVLAIKTEIKQQETSYNSLAAQNYPKNKESIAQIKMIHKESRVQNIIEWNIGSKSFKKSESQMQSQPKYFLILSYTKIQLYTVSSTDPSTITLSQVFSTPFLIPFNIINLKNPKQQLKAQQSKLKLQKDKSNRLQFDEGGQKYKIGMVGIDRSQTFWSGYYEIETSKRNLYLFEDFVIRPKEVNQRQNEQKIQQREINEPPRMLRRIRSAENIFEVSNKSIYLQQQSQKLKKEQLSSTQINTKGNQVSKPWKRHFNNDSRNDKLTKGQRVYRSPESTKYTQVSMEQSITSNSDKKSINRLRQLRQPQVSITRQSRTQKMHTHSQQSQIRILPTQLNYSYKLQLSPSLLFSSKQTSPFQSPTKKSQKPNNRNIYSYNSNKCHPPIQHIHHFYSQTLVQIKIEYRGSQRQSDLSKSNKKRYRKQQELMVLVGYWNVVVLVNVQRGETVSRVELGMDVVVGRLVEVSSMFGIFSAIILTKPINTTSNNQCLQKPYNNQNKLIKVAIDTINHQQLGTGLQPIKLPSLSKQQQVIDCHPIWNPHLLIQIQQLIEKLKLQYDKQDQQMKLKQSYDEVMMDLAEVGKQDKEDLQDEEQQEKLKEGIKNDPELKDEIREDTQQQVELRMSKIVKALDNWMGIPINQLQYCVIITTSLPRIILYNHVRTTTTVLYDPSISKPISQNKQSQTLQQSTQPIHNIFSIKKLSVTPIYIKQNLGITGESSPKLSVKIAMMYSTDINNFIAKCNNNNSNNGNQKLSHNRQVTISLIKQLKRITLC